MKTILIFLLLGSGASFGQTLGTSREFADYCGAVADAAPGEIFQWKDNRVEKVRWCFAYMQGLWEGLSATGHETGNSSMGRYTKVYGFCLVGQRPLPMTQDDIRIVVRYIRIHPDIFRTMIGTAVVYAFREAYPCPKDSIPDKPRK